MTVLEHLGELRIVLLQSILALAIGSIAGWFVSERAIEALIEPASQGSRPLVFFGPADALMLRMKASIGIGLFACAPVIVWRLWSFLVPGLLRREKQALLPIVVGSLLLFYAGAAFAYFVIVPVSIKFLLGFSTASLQPMISGDKYFDFLLRVTLSFAAIFQFPLVTTVLTMWGILPADFLRRHWRAGVVIVFVAAALLTPPDVASQLLMAGPLLFLYLLAAVAAAIVAPKKQSLLGPMLPRGEGRNAGQST
jgi:sec-independent protein translocase protein TatC